jgi:hypothetical protein
MPTQIIDNFDLNTAKPLDNRLVVGPNSFYTTKDSITYKYEGMRVWDINDGVPYVWTGTTFSSENNIAVTGTGIQNYLAKFGAASNVIGTSQVFDDGTNVGLGTSTPSYKLDVNGRIRTYGAVNGFVGDGSLITGLNATNINAGLMGIQYLQGGNTGWILTANNASSTTYKNPTTINVGSATTLQTSRSFWGQSFNGSANVSGNITGAGTIQFGTQTSKATLTYTTNTPRLLTVPNLSGDRTFAFINESQTFSAPQTISGNIGTLLTVSRSANGNNYTFFSTTGPNNVGIFFQNSGSARSLYMDGSGNLITGGNVPHTNGFNNFRLSSSGLSLGSLSYPGTTIRKIIVGTVIVSYTNISVANHSILYGSGFTLEYHSHVSTSSYAAVYVKITGGVVGSPVVIASIEETGILSMSPTSVLTGLDIANNRFLIQVGGAGTTGEASIQISFSYFEV